MDSPDENGSRTSPSPSKKRKRQDSAKARDLKRVDATGSSSPKSSLTLSPGRSIGTPEIKHAEELLSVEVLDKDKDVPRPSTKRRSTRLGGDDAADDQELAPATNALDDVRNPADDASSNGDEIDIEDPGEDEADAESLAKHEEMSKSWSRR